jgi:hypothetical protein
MLKAPKYEPLKMANPQHSANYGKRMLKYKKHLDNTRMSANRDRYVLEKAG